MIPWILEDSGVDWRGKMVLSFFTTYLASGGILLYLHAFNLLYKLAVEYPHIPFNWGTVKGLGWFPRRMMDILPDLAM